MRKALALLPLLFNSLVLPAQTLTVRYQTKDPTARKRYDLIARIDPDRARAIYKALSAVQTFELINSQGRSRFTHVADSTILAQHQRREAPWRNLLQKRFAQIEVYKNFAEGYYQEVKYLRTQKVCIRGALKNPRWNITEREKHIGKYRVVEAYRVDPSQPRDTLKAWFAPELSTFDGPFTAWGLPGLILEYQSAKAHAIARSVRFERKNTPLQPVSGVRTITAEKYQKLTRHSGGSLIIK